MRFLCLLALFFRWWCAISLGKGIVKRPRCTERALAPAVLGNMKDYRDSWPRLLVVIIYGWSVGWRMRIYYSTGICRFLGRLSLSLLLLLAFWFWYFHSWEIYFQGSNQVLFSGAFKMWCVPYIIQYCLNSLGLSQRKVNTKLQDTLHNLVPTAVSLHQNIIHKRCTLTCSNLLHIL